MHVLQWLTHHIMLFLFGHDSYMIMSPHSQENTVKSAQIGHNAFIKTSNSQMERMQNNVDNSLFSFSRSLACRYFPLLHLERKIKYWGGEIQGEKKARKRKGQKRTVDERSRGCWTMFAWTSASFSISTPHFSSLSSFFLSLAVCHLSHSQVSMKRAPRLTALLELEQTHTQTRKHTRTKSGKII